jgi:hypothetical protein
MIILVDTKETTYSMRNLNYEYGNESSFILFFYSSSSSNRLLIASPVHVPTRPK